MRRAFRRLANTGDPRVAELRAEAAESLRAELHRIDGYSRTLLHHCLAHDIPLIYASSAAVYGSSPRFSESHENELPLNVYGWSKLLFDRYVQRLAEQAERDDRDHREEQPLQPDAKPPRDRGQVIVGGDGLADGDARLQLSPKLL